MIILHQHWLVERFAGTDVLPRSFIQGAALGIPIVMLGCAVAMVSSLRYVHVTNRYLRGQKSFGYVVRLVVPIVLAIWWFQETVALFLTAYVCSGPITSAARRLRRTHTKSAET